MRFDKGTLMIAGGAAIVFLLFAASAAAKSGSTDLTGLKVGDRLRVDVPGKQGSPTGDLEVTAIVPGVVGGMVVLVKTLTGTNVGTGSVPLDPLVALATQSGGKVTRV